MTLGLGGRPLPTCCTPGIGASMLLRYGMVYSGGQAWTRAHDPWLRGEAVISVLAPTGARCSAGGQCAPRW